MMIHEEIKAQDKEIMGQETTVLNEEKVLKSPSCVLSLRSSSQKRSIRWFPGRGNVLLFELPGRAVHGGTRLTRIPRIFILNQRASILSDYPRWMKNSLTYVKI